MIVKDAPGDKKAKSGDFVELHVRMSIDDSLMTDSKRDNQGKPFGPMPVQESQMKGDLWDGIKLLSVGDSAVFLVSIDSMIAQQKKMQPDAQVPPMFQGKKFMKYEVVLVSVKTKDELQKENDAKNAGQAEADEKLLQEYFTKNNITATKTPSGLYYVVTQEGTGETIKAGQTAEMKYIGKTMDGKVFDANMGPEARDTKLFEFTVGQGMVIRGWDEGLQLLKKGSKATLYIPSTLAYGANPPSPAIPANAVLIFDVEVANVK